MYEALAPGHPSYPWRMVVARHTGLPALLRGFLDGEGLPDIADRWLFRELRAQALFGISASDAQQRFKRVDTGELGLQDINGSDV